MMKTKHGKVVITGGSGYLGCNLAQALSIKGYDVAIISRNRPTLPFEFTFAEWDGYSLGQWVRQLEGSKAIVNLAGKSVDCIKTAENADGILRSRIETTKIIGEALKQCQTPPSVWVQMSTAHIYGDSKDRVCSENDAFGYGLAPFVGKAWEEAYLQAIPATMRQVIFRTSFVLGGSGGALPKLAKLVRYGLGGAMGHGQQGISWIHEADLNELFIRAIEEEEMSGAYIATAPNPVSNLDFMRSLRKVLRVPFGLPSPAWLINLGAPIIAKTDPELALYGRYVVSQRLKEEAFKFQFPTLELALDDIYA